MAEHSVTTPKIGGFGPLLLLCALLVGELLAISVLYNHNFEFVCRNVAPAWICAGLSGAVVRAVAMAGVGAVLLIARREVLEPLVGAMRPRLDPGWLAVHFAGMAALLAPWLFVSDASGQGAVGAALGLWIIGGAAAALGALLALVRWTGWVAAMRLSGPAAAIALGVAALAPEIGGLFQNVWKYDPVTEITFGTVRASILALGYEVFADPPTKELIVGSFGVLVGPQCSGVEGFLLIGSFLGFYIWLFRAQLRFPHVLSLLVVGVILSWCFNVVRVVALILIGHHWSPELAINGFHSHAGWLMFTIIAVGLALAAHAIPWFRRDTGAMVAAPRSPQTAAVPFGEDPYVAQILPFLVFMASALLASTFFEVPGVAYPLRFVAMVAGLWIAVPFLMRLTWRLDLPAIGAGVAIGGLWILLAPAADPASPLALALAAMGPGLLAIWIATRVIGTVALVPAIEELFFRGYVLGRMDTGGRAMRAVAVVVSTALFAALHGRYLEAAIAGLVFAGLMLRSGRLADAILAHMAANAVIALWAIVKGDWSVI